MAPPEVVHFVASQTQRRRKAGEGTSHERGEDHHAPSPRGPPSGTSRRPPMRAGWPESPRPVRSRNSGDLPEVSSHSDVSAPPDRRGNRDLPRLAECGRPVDHRAGVQPRGVFVHRVRKPVASEVLPGRRHHRFSTPPAIRGLKGLHECPPPVRDRCGQVVLPVVAGLTSRARQRLPGRFLSGRRGRW